jgi:hypothetical protein
MKFGARSSKFAVKRDSFGYSKLGSLTLSAVSALMLLCGCAAVKETAKGFAGISTNVLEDKRGEALRKEIASTYPECYAKVKRIVESYDSYIYADDAQKRLLAIYVSKEDTTAVGIFFTEVDSQNTLLEVSSPSTYAKELVAKRIFSGLESPASLGVKGEAVHVK